MSVCARACMHVSTTDLTDLHRAGCNSESVNTDTDQFTHCLTHTHTHTHARTHARTHTEKLRQERAARERERDKTWTERRVLNEEKKKKKKTTDKTC